MLLIGQYPRRPWKPWEAAIDIVLLYAVATLIAMPFYVLTPPPFYYSVFPGLQSYELPWAQYIVAWFAFQIALLWLLASWTTNRGVVREVFKFQFPPQPRLKVFILILSSFALIFAVNYFVQFIETGNPDEDFAVFIYLLNSPLAWLAIVMMVLVAPICEESLFRGWLLPALSSSRLGFWGAATTSSFLWSIVHMYSIGASVAIFVSGIILCLLVRHTGTLLVSTTVHALLNGYTAWWFVTQT